MGGQFDFIAEAKTAFLFGPGFWPVLVFFFGGGGVGGAGGLLLYPNTVKLKLSESTTLGIYEGSRN